MLENEKIKQLEDNIITKYNKLLNLSDNLKYSNYIDLKNIYDFYTLIGSNSLNEFDDKLYNFLDDNLQTNNIINNNYFLDKKIREQKIINSLNGFSKNEFYNIIIEAIMSLDYEEDSDIDKLNDITLTCKEKEELMTCFLKEMNPKYKNVYNDLSRNGHILFINDHCNVSNHNDSLAFSTSSISKENNDYYIALKNINDIENLKEVAHEIGHILENIELKEILSTNKLDNYIKNSIYRECDSIYYSLQYLNFLEKNNIIDKKLIGELRKSEFIKFIEHFTALEFDIPRIENWYSLTYSYGEMISIYLDSIEEKDTLLKVKNKFNKEKLTNKDIEIFKNINVDEEKIRYSMNKILTKM